jgi:cell division protein FtsB
MRFFVVRLSMSALHSDGSIERDAIEVAAQVSARVNRAAKDQQAENAQLRRRIDEVERIVAALTVRLDALEALADVVLIDTPIPFMPAQFAEAA